jgi:hypothetical protein
MIRFAKDDFDVVVQVIDIIPELKICALALKRARTLKIEYPIRSVEGILKLLQEKEVLEEGHIITPKHIKHYMTEDQFPINDEHELALHVYLSLCRCNEDLAWASQAPDNASIILEEYQNNFNLKTN